MAEQLDMGGLSLNDSQHNPHGQNGFEPRTYIPPHLRNSRGPGPAGPGMDGGPPPQMNGGGYGPPPGFVGDLIISRNTLADSSYTEPTTAMAPLP